MRPTLFTLLLALFALTGCYNPHAIDEPYPLSDGGPTAPDSAPPPIFSCVEEPDDSCPEASGLPLPGAACNDGLACEIPSSSRGFPGTWRLQCESGGWRYLERPQSLHPPHNEQPLPPAEYCLDPFTGTRSESAILVGPTGMDEFRVFENEERVQLTRGGQGAYMLEFRMDVPTGRDLQCVSVEASVTIEGRAAGEAVMQVEAHCGRTRRMYLIVDAPECDFDSQGSRDFPLTLHLNAPGLGQGTIPLVLEHGPCELG